MDHPIQELSNPSADMVAAFQNASSTPPEPQSPPAPEVSAPAPVQEAAVEPGTVAPPVEAVVPPVEAAPAFDPSAWLQEQYKASPDEVKNALALAPKVTELEAQVAQANAIRELLSDPAKGKAFLELTSQDFGKLQTEDPKAVLFAQFKTQNPQYSEEGARIRFEGRFAAEYPGFDYDDEDSDVHRHASLLVKEDAATAAQFMQEKQTEARKALEAPVSAAPEGPTAPTQEQIDAQLHQVEEFFTGLEGFDFDVDGQKVSMPITNLQAVKDATLDFGGFIMKLATTDGKYDVQKAAMLAYKLTEDIAGHAAKAAKGSAGPVVKMAELVNNPSAQAPAGAHPGDRAGMIAAIAATARPSQDLNY